MSDGIQLIIRPDGVAEKYDDTYDLTIHCTCEDEQKEVLKIMETAAELRQLKPHGALIDRDALKDIKFQDTNHDYRLGWNEAIEAIIENADVIIEGSEANV